MELSGENLLHYKQKLVGCLRAFDEFCSSYHLNYFAAYGTCIGAVRHQGIIPWDDDIDVYMPREDYNRLLNVRIKLSMPYAILTPEDEGYFKPFAKLADMSTSVWETKNIAYMSGVWIDLFPLDIAPSNTQEAICLKLKHNMAFWNMKRSLNPPKWEDIMLKISNHRSLHDIAISLYTKFWLQFRKKTLTKKYQQLEKQIRKYDEGSHVTSYYGEYKEREVLDISWFADFKYVPFESYKIRIPIGYDLYLHHVYGDYMKLPPIYVREHLKHSHYYYNLERHVTIEEAEAWLEEQKEL